MAHEQTPHIARIPVNSEGCNVDVDDDDDNVFVLIASIICYYVN